MIADKILVRGNSLRLKDDFLGIANVMPIRRPDGAFSWEETAPFELYVR